jgi:hypothetical protein
MLPLFGAELTRSTAATVIAGVLMAATVSSEFAFMFWLMIKGAGDQAPTREELAPGPSVTAAG